MKKNNPVIIAFVVILLMVFTSVNLLATDHHNDNDYNKFSFGLHGGTLISFTDIKESSFVPDSDEYAFGGGLFLNYHLSPILTLRGDFLYGEMKGRDTGENRMFEAEMMQAMFIANISLNGLLAPQSRSNNWMNIYVFTGAGLLFHKSEQTDIQGNLIRYPYDANEADVWHNFFAIPFGLGINFKLSNRLDIGVKTSFYYAFTDELDAYVVPDTRKDMYNYTSVGFTFRLGRNSKSKDWAPIQSTVYPGDIHRMDAMSARIVELEEKLEEVEAVQSAAMEEVHKELEGVTQQQQQLNSANVQLYGALEDIAQRLLHQEGQVRELIEKAKVERYFSVQVLASSEELSVEEVKSQLGIGYEIDVIYVDGWYKYFSGKYQDLEDAKLHMQRIWGQGVRDAFIVVYENGNLTPR